MNDEPLSFRELADSIREGKPMPENWKKAADERAAEMATRKACLDAALAVSKPGDIEHDSALGAGFMRLPDGTDMEEIGRALKRAMDRREPLT